MVNESIIEKEVLNYFKEVIKIYMRGDYTEGTYRTPFENFIKGLNSDYTLIQEPQRITGLGTPDFKAFYGARKVGFIEAKDIDKNLDEIIETDQIKKYREGIDNLLLTNYLRFILIRRGHRVYDCNLFTLYDLDKGHPRISDDKIEEFHTLITEFFGYSLPTITSAEELAEELSKRAKLLKELAKDQLLEDLEKIKSSEPPSSIYDFYEGIKELIKDISIEDCADAYAQTVTYGLFLARRGCQNKLDRKTAAYYIPKNVGVIKRIFLNISGVEFPPNISWIVDDIIDILNASKLDEILTKIDKRGKKDKDPVIFFYEDFLNYYEPEKRKHLGVYYTPRPVVNFIVNSVHSILKKYFDKPLGLADDSVNVLDPAIGTGTFFWIAFLIVFGELKNQGLRGIIFEKIRGHLLKHFYGFEILITPYVISHLKLGDLLQKWHYNFRNGDRIQVYLTNTLEPSEVHGLLPFMREITDESRIANQIKLKKPILVVMGNPPYSVSSSNKSKWIIEKMEEYKKDLKERNIQPLDDDYIKFIRFAQWKIEQNGQGIVGFITNNSYLDGIIHRQMRKSLFESFDRIYILNLHGSSRKNEKCPDGRKDVNVFDIQQGVAVGIFIKNKKLGEKKVYYADLWGSRGDKYRWLDRHTIVNVKWQELKHKEPYYFFVPKDLFLQNEYERFWKITDIFKDWSSGVKTHRDHFIVGFTKEEIVQRLKVFTGNLSGELIKEKLRLKDTRDWKVKEAREKAKKVNFEEKIYPYAYRPFDNRLICYELSLIDRGCDRWQLMKHLLSENMAIATTRKYPTTKNFGALVGSFVGDIHFVSDQTYFFSLYLYLNENREKLLDKKISIPERIPNFTVEFLKFISKKYNRKLTSEKIFYYIYAILYSPTYRKRYEEFLRYDFPRIPFVDDYEKFKNLSELGKELVDLHLMKKKLPTKVKFDIPGSNVVEKVRYENGKVAINNGQYFNGVPEDVWDFYIGGYQVLDKWLKSRKNRKLEGRDIEQFLQIVEIIRETIKLMEEIDKIKIF